MIIDAHNHVDWLGFGADKLVENMKTNSIDKTWLLSWEVPIHEVDRETYTKIFRPDRIGMPFPDILDAVSRYPEQFVPGYCPDPRKPYSLDRFESAIEHYGIKVCGELKLRMMFDNLDALLLYRLCARYKLPVVVHIDYPIHSEEGTYTHGNYWYGGGMAPFERAVKKCPETTFIGHGPGFWAHISKDDKYLDSYYPEGPILPVGDVLRMLRDYPNLHADLSANSARNALSRDRGFGKEFLLEFQDRLLFARDEFNDNLYRLLIDFDLPKEVLNKILAVNAMKLLSY